MRLCGPNKPILPVMSEEGEVLRFNGWASMQRHPFTMYADFEPLLENVYTYIQTILLIIHTLLAI